MTGTEAQLTGARTEKAGDPAERNDVLLRGRLPADPEARTLPSGDEIMTWRVVVARDPRDGPKSSDGRRTATVDTLDCTGWRSEVRRHVRAWRAGDVVEVEGTIRRRFFRAAGTPASRWDVLARKVRRVVRAAD